MISSSRGPFSRSGWADTYTSLPAGTSANLLLSLSPHRRELSVCRRFSIIQPPLSTPVAPFSGFGPDVPSPCVGGAERPVRHVAKYVHGKNYVQLRRFQTRQHDTNQVYPRTNSPTSSPTRVVKEGLFFTLGGCGSVVSCKPCRCESERGQGHINPATRGILPGFFAEFVLGINVVTALCSLQCCHR